MTKKLRIDLTKGLQELFRRIQDINYQYTRGEGCWIDGKEEALAQIKLLMALLED